MDTMTPSAPEDDLDLELDNLLAQVNFEGAESVTIVSQLEGGIRMRKKMWKNTGAVLRNVHLCGALKEHEEDLAARVMRRSEGMDPADSSNSQVGSFAFIAKDGQLIETRVVVIPPCPSHQYQDITYPPTLHTTFIRFIARPPAETFA